MEEGLYIPVQYHNGGYNACIVIENIESVKAHAEALICKLLGIEETKGKIQFADVMTKEEAVAYNQGYEKALQWAVPNAIKIDGPDIYLDGVK